LAESTKSQASSIRQRPSLSSYSRISGRVSNAAAAAFSSREDEESGSSRRWRRGLKSSKMGKGHSSSLRG
jgi:hypothetical protein